MVSFPIRLLSKKLRGGNHRYYEKEGLLPHVKRNDNGKRLYDEEDLSWIHFVTALRATGMPIAQILKYLYLYKEGDSTISERKLMMLNHKKRNRAKHKGSLF